MSEAFRFRRADYRRPSVQLTHVDLTLRIYDDHVVGEEELHLLPRTAVSVIELDAQELIIDEVSEICSDGSAQLLTVLVLKRENRLEVVLPREYQVNEKIVLAIKARCRPTHNILEGLYYDTTPPGAPPQIISQCQQWGFQRIMPMIDDCTAKCTWRTTLEGSSRYTHLITNGDICPEANPEGVPVPVPRDPSRMRITYVNTIPMPPYLFIAAAGTWDVLVDHVTTEAGRTIRLEYLVPPGMLEEARIPMEILKDAVQWQAKRLDYDYQRDCYRTICMEKSNFGGMENVGNTTIITEAALIDVWTTDRRLIYAHGVIIHEFEHNHCGGDVTMETPFDMWLNEAFTVNLEREYVREQFGADLMRLSELDAMRDPLQGPLAVEDGGKRGRIVREGFNHPDEVVDGVTYVKAPEVLGMLRVLMGPKAYARALDWYFAEYDGGNAGTDDFLDAFRKFTDLDLNPFFSEWLFSNGYPAITGRYAYEATHQRLTVRLAQERRGGAGGVFTVPLRVVGVDADGCVMPSVDRTIVLDSESVETTFEGVVKAPAFLDWDSGGAFYGSFSDQTATPDILLATVRQSPFVIGRVEAMRRLTDIEMVAAMGSEHAAPSSQWLALFPEWLSDTTLPDGIRARLLTIFEDMLDRDYLPRAVERNSAARRLRRQVAAFCGERALLDAFERVSHAEVGAPMRLAIPRRALCGALAVLLAEAGPDGSAAVEAYFDASEAVTDRINAARALQAAGSPLRFEVMGRLRNFCVGHVGAYGAYLQTVASSPHPDVFEAIAREAASADFRIEHPGHSRSLYSGLAANNAQLWSEQGLVWAEEALIELASVNEYVALTFLSAFQLTPFFQEPLRTRVRDMLERLSGKIAPEKCLSLHARIVEIVE